MVVDDAALRALAEGVGEALLAVGLKLVTAESCTGGWIAKAVTDIPGSSAWFERGFVTYTNEAKVDLLGVSPDTLARFGAVSEQTVAEMVAGALDRSRAEVGVAVSGIAGPTGGTPDKPVGTVWIAWKRVGGLTRTELFGFSGDREAVRRQAVFQALGMIADVAGV